MTPETIQPCRIEMFGPLRLIRQNQITTRFRLQKAAALLAYLALNPQRVHTRERLIEMLWPERDTEAGRDNLSTVLSALRHELEPAGVPPGRALIADRQTIGLRPEAIVTDVAEFDALLKRARSAPNAADRTCLLGQAVELYRGDLLEGFYEEWALTAQEAYRQRYRETLFIRAQDLETGQDWDAARAAAKQALEADPVSEGSALVLMRTLARQGQTAQALEVYRQLEQRLSATLDTLPAPELRELSERLRQEPERPLYRAPQLPPAPIIENAPVRNILSENIPIETVPQEQFELEAVGGAVPLDSPYYIVRPADVMFQSALKRRESIVLVKGPGQTGKTSLLARGLQQARQSGATTVLTDFQKLSASHWNSADLFYQALAQNIVDRLDLDVAVADVWRASRGANENFEWFLRREVIARCDGHLVWGLDEVDRLFPAPFHNDVFSLFRSWHNERALDPDGPWRNLTLAISYATEAHLFITDLNQSPFNVGTRLTLEDFTPAEVAELNRSHRSPLNESELARFYGLVGGHPYLVRCGLHEIVTRPLDLEAFAAQADHNEGCYGNHLRRMLMTLTQDPVLCSVVRELVQNLASQTRTDMPAPSFHRLHSAGILLSDGRERIVFRCGVYGSYLERHL